MPAVVKEPGDACEGWERYPLNLPETSLLGIDAEYFSGQLTKLSDSFCTENEAADKEHDTPVATPQVHLRSIHSQGKPEFC